MEEEMEKSIGVTQADVQAVINENPMVALQVQNKALMRHIKQLQKKTTAFAQRPGKFLRSSQIKNRCTRRGYA